MVNLPWSKPGLELDLEPGQEIALVRLLITCQDLKAPTKSIRYWGSTRLEADGYSEDAIGAVAVAKQILGL